MTFSCIVLPSNLQYFTPTLYTLLYSHYECVCVELGNVLKVLFNTLENCLKNTDKYNDYYFDFKGQLNTVKVLLEIVEVKFSDIPRCKTKEKTLLVNEISCSTFLLPS